MGNDKLYGYSGNDYIRGGKGNDTIYGGKGNDKIYGQYGTNKLYGEAGNDTITAGTGRDNIWGGKGNDVLQSGSGSVTTFHFEKGDGNDTIKRAKKSDIIQIDSAVNVAIKKYSSNKLQITYGKDKIIIDNYKFNKSGNIDVIKVKQSNGSYKQLSISEELNGGNVIHINSDVDGETVNLPVGNNTVVFDDAPNLYNSTIISANTAGNGYTDTFRMTNANEGLSLMNNTLIVQSHYDDEKEIYTDNLWLDATLDQDYPGDGSIIYQDFYKSTAPNIVLNDNDRAYTAKGYNSAQNLTLTNDTQNRFIAINADTGENTITSNHSYNVICSLGGASLNYTYGGGHDNVVSLDATTNDTYNVNLTSSASVNITDYGDEGGLGDSLIITGTSVDNLRVLFDVNITGGYSSSHFILTQTGNISADMLAKSTLLNAVSVNGINVQTNFGSMENVTVGDDSVDIDTWCCSIRNDVINWLTTNEIDSVYDVFYGENPYAGDDLATLVACYDKAYTPAS